jgi:DNA polymerase-3 subunit delta
MDMKPVYILCGHDEFLIDVARKEIVSAVAGEGDAQLCVAGFDATVELAQVLDELRTLPFLAPRRVVIVRDAEAFVAANRQGLENYLQSPAKTASLMLIVSSWPSNTKLYKLVKTIGEVISCDISGNDSAAKWLATFAKKRGKGFSADARTLLLELVGQDLALLDSEVEKLSLYAGERKTIEASDVAKLVSSSAGPEAFAITNAVTRGDAAKALEALAGMMIGRGEEFKVLGMLGWHLRRALGAQQAVAAGQPPARILPNMPFNAQNDFLAMLKRRPLIKLHRDFGRLLAADLAMKSGANPLSAMQELVVALCM